MKKPNIVKAYGKVAGHAPVFGNFAKPKMRKGGTWAQTVVEDEWR